jgi:hypothetical protein
MSVKDLINAIATGNAIETQEAFQAVMAEKISARLDNMRVEVAQNMFKEEVEELDERNKENATRRKMMDASRGARWKVQNKMSGDDVRDWDGKHKTPQAQNKAIGRALRNEEVEELYLEDYSLEEIEDFMMSEDFEQLDELSKEKLKRYVKKASADSRDKALDVGIEMQSKPTMLSAIQKFNKSAKRVKGISTAVDKLTKEDLYLEDYSLEELEDFMMSEDFEQLDELSQKVLKRYVNKNLKTDRHNTSQKGVDGLHRATHSIAKNQATSTLDNKVRKLGDTSHADQKNPFEYDAARTELKKRGIHWHAGRRSQG